MKEKKIKAICCASLLFGLIMCFSSCDTLSGDIGEVYSIAGNPQRTVIYMIQSHPTFSSSYPQPWECYIYDSCDGNSILIAWSYKKIQESLSFFN